MPSLPTLGIIGLGEMGDPFARNLIAHGYVTHGYDLVAERQAAFAANGGLAADSIASLLENVDVLITSLPSSDTFLEVASAEILPRIRPGQIVIETGTTVSYEFSALAKEFGQREAHLVDAPVSGGKWGAEHANLKVFLGASPEIVETIWPILSTLGGPNTIYHCGPAGSGQAMKGVNQLKMAFENAMYLEILAYSQRCGLDLALIEEIWGNHIAQVSQHIRIGKGEELSIKFRELPYFVEDAAHRNLPLPITTALHRFCANGQFDFQDDHRAAPSFWHELNSRPANAVTASVVKPTPSDASL